MTIFLTGERNVGKTTIISRICAGLPFVPAGFRTIAGPRAEGRDQILLIPFGAETSSALLCPDPKSVVATRFLSEQRMELYPELFDSTGAGILKASREAPDTRLIVMDELGFMENDALVFQEEVLRCLDIGIPVLGVVKPPQKKTPFLESVRSHPSVRVVEVTTENREAVFEEVKDIFSRLTVVAIQ
jgi:nucleoside-triphosphatase